MKMPMTLVIRVLARVFARLLASLTSRCLPSSSGLSVPFRDGTDPLLGGHRAERSDRQTTSHEAGGAP